MKKLFLSLVLASIALAVYAASVTITITLTPQQLRGLQYVVGLENNRRTNAVPPLPALTLTEYAQIGLTDLLNDFAARGIASDRQTIADKYNALSAQDKATVDSLLR